MSCWPIHIHPTHPQGSLLNNFSLQEQAYAEPCVDSPTRSYIDGFIRRKQLFAPRNTRPNISASTFPSPSDGNCRNSPEVHKRVSRMRFEPDGRLTHVHTHFIHDSSILRLFLMMRCARVLSRKPNCSFSMIRPTGP